MQSTTQSFTVEEQAVLSLLAWRVLLGRAQHALLRTQGLQLRPGDRFSVMDVSHNLSTQYSKRGGAGCLPSCGPRSRLTKGGHSIKVSVEASA